MASLEELRRFALGLPETAEAPHHAASSFRVKGKIFATIPPHEGHLNVMVDEDEAQACAAEGAKGIEELWWGKKLAGVRVTLAHADADRVKELLVEAWRRKAPKKLVAEYDNRHGAQGGTW